MLPGKYPRNRLRELYGGRLRDMPGAMELLEKMLVLDPRKRITAMQAVYSVGFWVLGDLMLLS